MKTVNKKLGLLIETVEYDQQVMDTVMKEINDTIYLEDESTYTLHVGKKGVGYVEKFLSQKGFECKRQSEETRSSYREFSTCKMIGGCVLTMLVNPEIELIDGPIIFNLQQVLPTK